MVILIYTNVLIMMVIIVLIMIIIVIVIIITIVIKATIILVVIKIIIIIIAGHWIWASQWLYIMARQIPHVIMWGEQPCNNNKNKNSIIALYICTVMKNIQI